MPRPPSRLQLVHLKFDGGLLKRLEDFRFKHRFETRTAAVRWLLEWALERKPAVPPSAR